EDDDVAQRQHRIGPGLARNERRLWLCASHGPKSLLLCPPPLTRGGGIKVECRGGPGREARGALLGCPCAGGWVRNPPRRISIEFLRTLFFSVTIGGDGPPWCQVSPKIQVNNDVAAIRRRYYSPNRRPGPARALGLRFAQALASPVRSARSA